MWLLFDNKEQADAKEAEISLALGYPSGLTLRYAEPEAHPTDGTYALMVKCAMRCIDPKGMVEVWSLLSDGEVESLRTRDQMLALGWFPVPEDAPEGAS